MRRMLASCGAISGVGDTARRTGLREWARRRSLSPARNDVSIIRRPSDFGRIVLASAADRNHEAASASCVAIR